MKKQLLFALLLITGISYYSCTKTGDSYIPTITARINGVNWRAQTVSSYKLSFGTTNTLNITGADTGASKSGHMLLMSIYDFKNVPDTFKTDSIQASAGLDYGYSTSSGTIIVTKVSDNFIFGTFSFLTTAGVKVTEGQFVVKRPK